MSIPTLTFRERLLYRDTFTAYTPNNDGNQNVGSYSIAPVSDTDPTPLQNIPCNLHMTPNFDLVQGGIVLNKQVNIDTSDLMTCQPTVQIDSTYVILGTQRASAGGRSEWFTVQGEAENESLVPCTCVYIVPRKKVPVIV